MANSILTLQDITRESLRVLVGELNFVTNINREFDSRFGVSGAKIGYTTNVRIPPRYLVGTGAAITAQDHVETIVPVALTDQWNIGVEFTQADLAVSMDDFSDRFVRPAMKQLAAAIDQAGLSRMYKKVANQVGTPGTAFSSISIFFDAYDRLASFLAPLEDLKMTVNSRAYTKAAQLVTNLFTPSLNDDVVKNYIGDAFGFSWYLNQQVATHTVGAYGAGTLAINGAAQSGSTLVADGFANSAVVLKAGDVFTIAGVFAVNPATGSTYDFLQQFVVGSDVTSNGAGQVSIAVTPALIATGAQKTVSALPADNAVITVAGAAGSSYPVNLAFDRDAFAFVSAPLAAEGGMSVMEVDEDSGLGIRLVRFYDGRSDLTLTRVDCLGGFAALRPSTACRIVTS